MRPRSVAKGILTAGGVALGTYLIAAGVCWLRFGAQAANAPPGDPLDDFLPQYDIVERHHIAVNAPAAVTLAAAREHDLLQSGAVRAIFRTREVVLGATPDVTVRPRGLLAQMQSLGWGILFEVPNRQVIAGAVTKPWEANVTFRALPPADFAAYAEPGYVKITWTLRVDPVDPDRSVFITETRAVATDPVTRARFRRYWAFASPGIITIRWLVLRPVRDAAERRARTDAPGIATSNGGVL